MVILFELLMELIIFGLYGVWVIFWLLGGNIFFLFLLYMVVWIFVDFLIKWVLEMNIKGIGFLENKVMFLMVWVVRECFVLFIWILVMISFEVVWRG